VVEHSVREERGVVVASLSGDVDLARSPRARELLLGLVGAGRNVLVDLSAVGYIDSSGVASLIEAFQLARRAGTGFALVSPTASALRVLELARLDRVFTIHASLADAL
jgi:anti-sigma B factor antagonist